MTALVAGVSEVRHPTTPGATLVEQLRWQIPEAHVYKTATKDLLALAADEIESLRKRLSDTPTWRDAAHDPPADEQKVLAWWPASLCVEGYETVIHHAADAPDGPACWHDVHGHAVDAPELWCDHPKAPK